MPLDWMPKSFADDVDQWGFTNRIKAGLGSLLEAAKPILNPEPLPMPDPEPIQQPERQPFTPFTLANLEDILPGYKQEQERKRSASGALAEQQSTDPFPPFKTPDLSAILPGYSPPAATSSETPQAPATPRDISRHPASGTPAAMPTGGPPQQGDLRAYTRAKAQSLGIDPDIAERVAESEGGFDDPVRQSDVIYGGQREQSYGPYQLNVSGGLGSAALQQGIDPRNPEHAYRAVDFALENAAQNGWGAFHGAARVGIGERQGIGTGATGPTPTRPTVQAAASPQQASQADLYPRQDLLDDPDKWAVCGPLGVMAFGAMTGHPVDYETAKRVAKDAGWTAAAGMAGPQSQVAALRAIGVPTKLGLIDLETIAREVRNGNPVGLSSPGGEGHYFTVQGVDDQGRLDLGNSALSLRASGGTKRFWTLDELRAIGPLGNVTTAIYLDNPASPTPSVAAAPTAGSSTPAGASLAPPAAATAPPSAAPPAGGLVTIQNVDDGKTRQVPASQVDSWLAPVAPGMPPSWRVVGPQAQTSPLDAARAGTDGLQASALSMKAEQPADMPPDDQGPEARRFIPRRNIVGYNPRTGTTSNALEDENYFTPRGDSAQTWYPPGTRNRAVSGSRGLEEYTEPQSREGQWSNGLPRNQPVRGVFGNDWNETYGPEDPVGPYDHIMRDEYRQPLGAATLVRDRWADETPSQIPINPPNVSPESANPPTSGVAPSQATAEEEGQYQSQQQPTLTIAGATSGPAPTPPGYTRVEAPRTTVELPLADRQPQAAQDTGERYLDQSMPSPPGWQAIVDGAGTVVDWVRERAQGAANQISENMAGNRAAIEDANAGQSGGLDFGAGAQNLGQAAASVLDAATGPEGILEPTGGVIRTTNRLIDIQNLAAAELGRSPIDPRVTDDPGWRARHPDLAAEADELKRQNTLGLMGQLGDVRQAGRAVIGAVQGALPEPRRVSGEGVPRTGADEAALPAASVVTPRPPTSAEQGATDFAESAARGAVHQAPVGAPTWSLPEGVTETRTPISAGLASGYSPDDIKAFYLNRRWKPEWDADPSLIPPMREGFPPYTRERATQVAEQEFARDLTREPAAVRALMESPAPAEQGSTTAFGMFGPQPSPGRRPQRRTVEVIQEELSAAQRAAQSARRFGDDGAARQAMDEAARLESELADALNARRNLEPAIRSDMGRRLEDVPLDERAAEDFSVVGRERARIAPEDLSGPVGIPVDDPRSRLNMAVGPQPGPARRASSSRQVSPPPSATPSPAMEAVEAIRGANLITPERMAALIGDRPEYLADVAQHILDQRRKVVDGNLTVRDTAKAYYMTVASQGSDAVGVDIIEAKTPGFTIPERFWSAEPSADGRPLVRPEEAAAAWLFSPRGQQALNDLERGIVNREAWSEGAAVRRAFGDDRFRTNNVFSERAPVNGRTQFNMDSIQAFTDRFNEAARAGASPAELLALSKRLNGISEAKGPFLNHALGFGESPTIDAVEISAWLTGQGDVSRLQGKAAALKRQIDLQLKDRRVGTALGERVGEQFAAMRQLLPPEATADLPPEVFNHVLHHWIWDRMKGTATTHEGFYDALKNAAMVGPSAPAGAGRLAQVNADLGNAIFGGVAGATTGAAAPAETDEERRRNALIGAGVGMAGFPIAGRMLPRGPAAARMAVGPVPSPSGNRLGNVPPSQVNQGMLPGMNPLTQPKPGPVGNFPAPAVQAAVQRAQRQATPGLDPLTWLRRFAGEVGYSSMIGPATATVNLTGNLLEPLYAIPKEAARSIVRTGGLGEFAQMAGGAFHGMTQVGGAIVDALAARGRYASVPGHEPLSQVTNNPIGRAVTTGLEVGGRVFSGVPDAIFGTIATGAGEARAAAQAATDAGLKGAAWKRAVNDLLTDAAQVKAGQLPTLPNTQDIIDAGADYAKRQTFQTGLGSIGRNVRDFATMAVIPDGKGGRKPIPVLGNLVTPFFNTPWNMNTTLAERTPLGFAMNSQASRFDKYYDATLGSAVLAGLIAGPAASGLITGSGPSDPQKAAEMRSQGWRPYSVLIDGVYIPNRTVGVYGPLLNAVGDAHDSLAYAKDTSTGSVLSDYAGRLGKQIQQQPYLQGLANLLSATSATQQGGLGAGAEQYAASTITRMIPYAATKRTVNTAADPYERTVDRGKNVPALTTIGQQVRLGLGQREGLPIAQDVLGRPQENPQEGLGAFFSKTSRAKQDPIIQAFLENNTDISSPRQDLNIPIGTGTVTIPLAGDERRAWNQIRGEAIVKQLEAIVRSDQWKNANPEARQKYLQDKLQAADNYATNQLRVQIGTDELRRRVNEARALKAS